MENKKSFGEKLEAFFAGKGFYIVLFLCVAIIGVSAWAMLSGSGTDVDAPLENLSQNPPENNVPVIGRGDEKSKDNDVKAPDTDSAEEDADSADDSSEDEEANLGAQEPEDEIEPEAPEVETATWTENEPVDIAPAAFIWPVTGEVEIPYSVTSLIYNRTMADWRTHDGLDIAADIGTQVLASAAGRVESVYTDDHYGVTVIIDHMGGLKSVYSNLAEVPTVYVGDSIMSGEIIGAIGETALCEAGEAAHLHYKMTLDGQSVDPLDYLM